MTAPIVMSVAGQPIRILFVDDDEATLRALTDVCANEGNFVCACATSAAEARVLMEEDPADVVIADQWMPGGDGIALLARLRTVRPTLVRVLMSADADAELARRALADGGVHAILLKPWKLASLTAILKSASTQVRSMRIAAATDALAALRSFKRSGH